jgi:L,D-transpeptidase catalytic domain
VEEHTFRINPLKIYFMRYLLSVTVCIITLSTIGFCVYKKSEWVNDTKNTSANKGIKHNIEPESEFTRLKLRGDSLKKFIQKRFYNGRYCFLVDMKLSSGLNRFFVYDLQKDSVLQQGLVTQGSGIGISDTIQYSNKPNTLCTSLGRYKIGKWYMGRFGLAYKLFGLDETNSNAYARVVVLHAHPCVPDLPVYPLAICTSWGCPTVAPLFLNKLKVYIDESVSPVVLWVFK